MSSFVVHTIPGSPFARAVLATLEERGAAYRVAPVAPGTLKSEAHLALHPFGRIPVLDHDGFRLYDTQLSDFFVVTYQNPDAGACTVQNLSLGFTGRVYVAGGAVSACPLFLP
jgi:hypothetical protein